MEIDAAFDRLLFDLWHIANMRRGARQRVRQDERKINSPKAQRADKPLAFAGRLLAGARELGGDLGVEKLVAGLIELGHRPGFAKLTGEFLGGRRRRFGLFHDTDRFARADGPVVRPPRLPRDAQGRFGRLQSRRLEVDGGDVGPRRQGRQGEDVGCDGALDFRRQRARDPPKGKIGIGRKAFPHHDRFRDSEPVIGGLQTPIRAQGDLDRAIGVQRPLQQTPDAFLGGRRILGRANRRRVLAQFSPRHIGGEVNASVRREGGAGR